MKISFLDCREVPLKFLWCGVLWVVKPGANAKQLLNKKKTRRGNRKGKIKNKSVKFSLIGSNANGLSGKMDSLISTINFFKSPSCVTIQETKLRSTNLRIPGYQIFLKNRPGLGGGLLTSV